MLKAFVTSKSGGAAIECALIAGILMLAIATGATEVGRLIGQFYGGVGNDFSSVVH